MSGKILQMEQEYELLCGSDGWNHPSLAVIRERLMEQDDFVEHPFQVEEGVVECRCGSKRTFSTQIQARSSDEGFTLLVRCVECNSQWREN